MRDEASRRRDCIDDCTPPATRGAPSLGGGRPADAPQDDEQNDIYYICNLPAGALSHCRLVTLLSCHGAHHTALEADLEDPMEADWTTQDYAAWAADPASCGCVAHALLSKGAKCVVGFEHRGRYPGAWVWGRCLWKQLNKYPVSVTFAPPSADSALGQWVLTQYPNDSDAQAETLRSVADRFVGGDPANTYIRPGGWAE